MTEIAGIVETFITFGTQYKADPRHPDEEHPLGMHGDGYAAIEAPTRQMARDIAFALFGARWAFDYPEPPAEEYAPAGEILRIAWISKSTHDQVRASVIDTFEKAGGDSNDEEIESLQEARDLLMSVTGVSVDGH